MFVKLKASVQVAAILAQLPATETAVVVDEVPLRHEGIRHEGI
jgi:hypothetical protein